MYSHGDARKWLERGTASIQARTLLPKQAQTKAEFSFSTEAVNGKEDGGNWFYDVILIIYSITKVY